MCSIFIVFIVYTTEEKNIFILLGVLIQDVIVFLLWRIEGMEFTKPRMLKYYKAYYNNIVNILDMLAAQKKSAKKLAYIFVIGVDRGDRTETEDFICNNHGLGVGVSCPFISFLTSCPHTASLQMTYLQNSYRRNSN